MGTSVKHPVPEQVKLSFVIYDIWALWRLVLYPYGNIGRQRVKTFTSRCIIERLVHLHAWWMNECVVLTPSSQILCWPERSEQSCIAPCNCDFREVWCRPQYWSTVSQNGLFSAAMSSSALTAVSDGRQHDSELIGLAKSARALTTVTLWSYKKAVLSQRWPHDARYISKLWAVAEIWPFEIIQDGGDGRHLEFVRTENSAIRSAVPKNPTL